MKKLIIFLCVTILASCSKPNEDIIIATKYWDAQKNNNLIELEQLLAVPEEIETFKHMQFSAESFSVDKSDNGDILVSIKRFCYPDLIVNTEVIEVNGVKKIDSNATIKNLFKAAKVNNKTVKKYCYDFDDTELTGLVNGQPWAVKKVDTRVIDWGSKKTIAIALHPEDCDTEYSGYCKLPKLMISNLNLNGDGGNFSASENITIHTPPSENQIISTGSYRITHLNEEATKVEISFKHDEKNHLNGFVLLPNKT